jgi:hypothetical protein
LLLLSVFSRVFLQGKYPIKAIDLVFFVIPLLFVGLAPGKLRGLGLCGVKRTCRNCGRRPRTRRSSGRSLDGLGRAGQRRHQGDPDRRETRVNDIPRLIEQRAQALAFRLGMGGYYAQAIKKYFEDLYGSSYLRYVVVNHGEVHLVGIYDAADRAGGISKQGERYIRSRLIIGVRTCAGARMPRRAGRRRRPLPSRTPVGDGSPRPCRHGRCALGGRRHSHPASA